VDVRQAGSGWRVAGGVGLFAFYLLLAITLTWPLARNITTTVSDLGDPLLNTFILDWDCYALTHQPLHLFDAPFFYPSKYPLAYSEHLAGIALLCLPFYAAGLAPLTIYNIAMLIGFALSAYGGYVLARVVTGRVWPSVLAGILYGFIPYKFGHVAHLQIVSSGWLPLMLAALLVYRRSPTTGRAALFAGAFVMNGLTNIYYLLFGSVAIALTIALIAIAEDRDLRFWLRLGGALLVASLVLLPFLIPYKIVADTYDMKRGTLESEGASATWMDWLIVHWTSRLYAPMTDDKLRHGERMLSPGLLIVLLSAAAFFLTPRRPTTVFVSKSQKWLDPLIVLLAIATFFGIISPKYHAYIPAALLTIFIVVRLVISGRLRNAIAGSPFSFELWAVGLWIVIGVIGSLGMHTFFHSFLFHKLEPFRATRVPARWAMIAYTGLAGWAAAGAAMFRRRWIPPLLFVLALIDVWPRIRWEQALVEPPPVDRWLAQTHAGPLLELPIHRFEALYFYMLRATTHHVPIFDGLSGFEPPLHRMLREQPLSDGTYALIERNGCRYVLVRPEWFGGLQPFATAWLRRGIAQGRLAFVRRFDGGINGDWLFAVTRVEKNWQRFRVPSDDPQLASMLDGKATYSHSTFGQLYQPAPWSELKGPMTVSGWAMSPFGLREVNVLLDSGRTRIPTGLFARADVTDRFPWYPQTPRPAFATRILRRPSGVPVETDVQVEIIDGRGERTLLPDVLIVWR
jgi:hypothetical protein